MDDEQRPADETDWVCTYCNEVNETDTEPGESVGVDNCKRCGTRRAR